MATSTGHNVFVYLNQGDGTFGPPVVTAVNVTPYVGAMVVGDINEDGKQDLIVSISSGPEVAIPLLSNGDGTFSQQPPIPGSFGFLSGKLADLNGGGHLDLFLGGNGETSFFLGKGDGTFVLQANMPGSFPGDYFSIAIGDLNADKVPDVIAADTGSNQSTASPGSLDVFLGQAGGTFQTPTFLQPASITNPLAIDLADFDGDGKLDLLIAANGSVFIARGNGDGTFQFAANQLIPIYDSPVGTAGYSAEVDLNQDGRPDVVAVDFTAGTLTLALNDATVGFANAHNSPYVYQLPPKSSRVLTADFNGDGLPDLAVANSAGNFVSILLSSRVVTTPNISLTSSGNNLLAGSAVAFAVHVSGGGQEPTGSVSLMDGATEIGSQQLDTSGSAIISTANLSAGVHTLTASYSGDRAYSPASSSAISQSVADFQASLDQLTATVTAGASATYKINMSPISGFAGSVAFSCSGLPSLAQCSGVTANLSSGATSVNLVVSTAAATSARNLSTGPPVYFCALFGALSFCCAFSRKRAESIGFYAIVLMFLTAGLSGCGSSSSSRIAVAGTPSGSTTFTITATTTQNGVSLAHNANATLVVK